VPQHNQVYTVREVVPYQIGIGLWLNEIKNGIGQFVDGIGEPSFCVSGFRPLQDRPAFDFAALVAPKELDRVRRQLEPVEEKETT